MTTDYIINNNNPDTLLLADVSDNQKRKLLDLNFSNMLTQTGMLIDLTNKVFKDEIPKIQIIENENELAKWFSCLTKIFDVNDITLFKKFLKEKDIWKL
ncbi:MAG: hypothetical protein JXR64_13525 [Spirochaetales bacterium]|nr:hypothetical protein [Spirochaetales bacterium]